MTPFMSLVLALATFAAACALTLGVRRYAVHRQLLDVPNQRSSHAVATPRGGGLAIVIATLCALPVLAALGVLTWAQTTGIMGGGAIAALVGFRDDLAHVAPAWRLLAHFAAAAWVLSWLGGMPPLAIFGSVVDLGWVGTVLGAFYLVWMVNLTNFMDGIDGIAGVEAVTVCLGAAIVTLRAAPPGSQWQTMLVLGSATLGFLMWNWPPAKIFLGDVGSGFLGLMLATFSVLSAAVAPALFWSWLVLLGVFVVDATVTLMRRALLGQNVAEAHRSHAYQHAARRWRAHWPITVAVAAVNLGWLLPWAVLVGTGAVDGVLGVVIAYVPLFAIAWHFEAGVSSPAT